MAFTILFGNLEDGASNSWYSCLGLSSLLKFIPTDREVQHLPLLAPTTYVRCSVVSPYALLQCADGSLYVLTLDESGPRPSISVESPPLIDVSTSCYCGSIQCRHATEASCIYYLLIWHMFFENWSLKYFWRILVSSVLEKIDSVGTVWLFTCYSWCCHMPRTNGCFLDIYQLAQM